MTQVTQGWSVPVSVNEVPPEGRRFHLEADAAVRAAVAKALGLVDLPRLEAAFDLSRTARGVRLAGEVSATVVQSCVVTLEPVTGEVREPVEVSFAEPDAAPLDAAEIDVAVEDADPPDPLIDGRVDLGAVAVEFLGLGLDPYPRAPGAVFEPPAGGDEAKAGPFAALSALTGRPPRKG